MLLVSSPASAYLASVRASVQVRAQRSPLAEIPFTLVDDHIVVPASIDDSPVIGMLLDTGMPMKGVMLLDQSIAKDMDLEYSATVELGGGGDAITKTARVATGAAVLLGGFGFQGQQVYVLKENGFADDWPAAAVLGTTFFDHAVELDFTDSVIRLYESVDDLPEDPGYRMDLTFTMGIPVVEALIATDGDELLPVTLIADTGVNTPLLVFSYSDEDLTIPEDAVRTRTGVLSEGLTGDVKGEIGRVARLRLGPYDLSEVIAAFPTEASMGHATILGQNGFVGTGLFKRFKVVFDYPNGHLYLRPNEDFERDFEWNMAGLLMGINREGFLQVKDVVEGSPGAKRGIRANDVITGVNGFDLRDLDADDIQKLFNEEGAQLHLDVQRGSDRSQVTLTLRRII
jgi:hypothetical protein